MRAIILIFFLSGATGLVYEVLWAKYLGLFLGNTSHAQAIVLATFLGGLAIGNALFGRLADRHPHPLRLYGWLELGIAVLAGLSPLLLTWLGQLYMALPWSGEPIKMAFAAIALLPPTILMGGTLPALSRTLTRSLGALSETISGLYFLNSAGAVVGALAAGFWLIPAFGLDQSTAMTALLNAAIGAVAFLLAMGPARSADTPAAATADEEPLDTTALQRRAILIAVLVSGFVSLSLEIAWIRLLSLVLGGSTYSFSVMLAAFVAGISLGSFLVNRKVLPGRNPLVQFAIAEICLAASILVTLPFYDRLPYVFFVISGWFTHVDATFFLFEGIKFAFCFLLMLIPTTFLGMTLPFATLVVTRSVGEVATQVGRIFSLNTLGNVLGALLTGLFLLPLLSMKGVIDGGVLMCLLIAIAILWTGSFMPARTRVLLTALPLLAFLIYRVAVPGWDLALISSGPFRSRGLVKGEGFEAYRAAFHRQSTLYYKDDASATVAVTKDAEAMQIDVNGKTDASTDHDMPTQVMLGQLPLFLHPQSKDVFLVGLGSGVTAGAILSQPGIELTAVEISPAIAEAARFFGPYNHNVLDNPRMKLVVDDALSTLQKTDRRFDLIVCEPSNPWVAGNANLFTEDFYRVLRARLQPDGAAVQWVHTYELDNASMAMIWRTFTTVFPHVTLWQLNSTDWALIGQERALPVDFAAAEARFAIPSVREDLARIQVHDLPTVLSMQASDDAPVRRAAGTGPLNTLRFPRLEYHAPMAFYRQEVANLPYNLDLRKQVWPAGQSPLYLQHHLDTRRRPLSSDEFSRMVTYHKQASIPEPALRPFVTAWRRAFPQDPRARWEEVTLLLKSGQDRAAWAPLQAIVKAQPNELAPQTLANKLEYNFLQRDLGYLSPTSGAIDGLVGRIERLLARDPAHRVEHLQLLAKTHLLAGRLPQALAAYDRAAAAAPEAQRPELLFEAAQAAYERQDLRQTAAYAAKVLALQPDHPGALDLADAILRRRGD